MSVVVASKDVPREASTSNLFDDIQHCGSRFISFVNIFHSRNPTKSSSSTTNNISDKRSAHRPIGFRRRIFLGLLEIIEIGYLLAFIN